MPAMRSYPCNSPEAAARIVALVLIADGHVCRSEFEALQRLGAADALGLAPNALHQIVQDLCEDLLASSLATSSFTATIDASALASVMCEIDDPSLQMRVLELADAAAGADRHLAEGEALVLAAAARHWGLEQAAGVSESRWGNRAREPRPEAPPLVAALGAAC